MPLGAVERGGGVNFTLFSRHATRVQLEFYNHPEAGEPSRVVDLDPACHRTGDVWHVWVKGIQPGTFYAYRVGGPYDPALGHRFDFNKLLLDPLASALSSRPAWDFPQAQGFDPLAGTDLSPSRVDDALSTPKCVWLNESFDWQEVRRPHHPWSKTVLYEAHVRGFTRHPASGVANPGTYHGLTEKIPYFQSLGVTAVELMPVQEFNEHSVSRRDPKTGQILKDFWGYDPISFFAPKAGYSSSGGEGQQKLEFKEMVRAFHRAGIEIILDVVFNHTAEGDERGPTLSFRGLDNSIFYTLEDDKRFYKNFSGTGNTVNANHPVVRDHILSALRYWMVEMQVDGFRFDLASILGRDGDGKLMANAPLLTRIEEDPVLRDVKIIAEAWDAGGAYQVGQFSGKRWAEWNGRYRDEVRRFWRGDPGMTGLFATRLCGSPDLYTDSAKGPAGSINFITCHDGFTLNDLVSYERKHNEANGEGNRDGSDENNSSNYGQEGPTEDEGIEQIRKRQVKNLLLTLLVSRGVPMILGGDEIRRTQGGNNNAYCQDNETSWMDWELAGRQQEIFRFTQGLIALRAAHPVLSLEKFYLEGDLHWFNPEGNKPHWEDPATKRLACFIVEKGLEGLFLMFNADNGPADFALPFLPHGFGWRLAADTSLPPPDDLTEAGKEPHLKDSQNYRVEGRSSVILLARKRLSE